MIKLADFWKLYKRFSHRIFLILFFILFVLLLYKDPFSERTLIPNLEPYPDTIHYISPALSLISGNGFSIWREGRKLNQTVPPLYSLSLIPLYLLNADARVFYLTNLVLAFLSLFLFYKIINVFIKNSYIQYLLLFLYITNYFIYWLPTLAMAENLLLPLYLTSILLLISGINKTRVIIVGFFSVALYITKYASVPLSAVLIFLYGVKILVGAGGIKAKSFLLIVLATGFLSAFSLFGYYEYFFKKVLIITPLLNFFAVFFPHPSNNIVSQSSNTWTSVSYMKNNLMTYWSALNGGSMRFLWDSTPIVPKLVGSFGLIGIISGLFVQKHRVFALALALFIALEILFMSTFYTNDARYIYHVIPSLILGFGLLLNNIYQKINAHNLKIFFYAVLILFTINYLFGNSIRFKKQIMLNLKYAERPWYYISVKNINEYFAQNSQIGDKKPIVISALPPYYVDFFSTKSYTLLPLSADQEFRLVKYEAWGKNDYSDLLKLYSEKLRMGYPLYLSKYGLGNERYLQIAFAKVLENFKSAEVKKGCYETCNLYKLELKEKD